MKLIIMLIAGAFIIFTLVSCSRDLTNPLEADSDLNHQPKITSIQIANNQVVLRLDWSYSDEAILLFERKSEEAFEPITCQKLTASTFADNTLNLEQSFNMVYRVRVKKGDYQTEFSEEKAFSYNSTLIYAPTNFNTTTIELQGVRLNWQDNSSVETGYRIEKSENGGDFTELVSLAANATTYLHNIPGMPANPINLSYQIKAFNNTLSSSWIESSAVYSGLGAPTNLAITDSTFYHFTIEWTRNSTIATGYEIERKKDGGSFILIQTLGATAQTYTEQITEIGTYSYRVRAKKDAIYSSYTNEVSTQVSTLLPTEGLIAFYPFNGDASDESMNGHDGIAYGATLTTNRFGNPNSAFYFDGLDDYIRVSSHEALISPSYTISVWFKFLAGGSGNPRLIFKGEDNYTTDFDISTVGTGTSRDLNFYASINNQLSLVLSNTIEESVWYNVIGIVNQTKQALYLNGVEVDSKIVNGVLLNTDMDIYIGKITAGYSAQYKGSIDDIRIYNRELTEQEIQTLYHEGGWANNIPKKLGNGEYNE